MSADNTMPAWRVTLAVLVTLASLMAVVILWWDAWGAVGEILVAASWSHVLAALLLTLGSAWFNFVAYLELTRRALHPSLALSHLAHIYFAAQLLKHLPGRVWGIGYQAIAGSRVSPPTHWVAVSILHLLMAICVVVWLALVVLTWRTWPEISITIGLSGALVFLIASRCGKFLNARGVLSGTRLRTWHASLLGVMAKIGPGGWARVCGWLVFGTILGYLSWIFLASVGGVNDPGSALRLAAFYILAWLAGYIAIVAPAGLGVRELAFAWLANEFPPEVVASMAVLGRLALLATDVVWGLIFSPFFSSSSPRP